MKVQNLSVELSQRQEEHLNFLWAGSAFQFPSLPPKLPPSMQRKLEHVIANSELLVASQRLNLSPKLLPSIQGILEYLIEQSGQGSASDLVLQQQNFP